MNEKVPKIRKTSKKCERSVIKIFLKRGFNKEKINYLEAKIFIF